jgi:YebC/PmpR family DNA-binding regulatory protein
VSYETASYEGYGPGGVAVLVDVLTDNRNRTASDVRQAFTKAGGSLAEPGSVAFQFTRRGQVVLEADGVDEDELMLTGLDAGMEDLESEDDRLIAWCEATDVTDLRAALEAAGFRVVESGSPMIPSATVSVTDVGDARKLLRLLDMLDDNDDVQDVWANLDIDDDTLAAIDD